MSKLRRSSRPADSSQLRRPSFNLHRCQSSNDRHLLAACAAFGREGINPIQTIDTRQTHGRRAGRARPPLPFTDGIKELWSR